jgi:mRNA-degrading endonuclease toxin of MazEF toxin-antitoxin module
MVCQVLGSSVPFRAEVISPEAGLGGGAVIPGLFLAVPLSTRDRGRNQHIEVPADDGTGLKKVPYARTEQVRAMPDQRAGRQRRRGSTGTLAAISRYLHLFIV